ncbi:MAG: DNA polymerase III subunit alpha, partial [candidate division WOR-3 bacterium]
TLFERLKEYRITACGIVDNTLFGLPEFLTYARRYDITPIIGAHIAIACSREKHSRLYLFVENGRGYKNLCHIITKQAYTDVDLEYVRTHARGLTALSCNIPLLRELRPAFERIYYLVLPYHTPLRQEFPSCAAHEIFYVIQQDRVLYKLLCKIKNNTYEDIRGRPNHLMTHDAFCRMYADYPEAIENNQKIARECTYVPEYKNWIFAEPKHSLQELIWQHSAQLDRIQKNRVEHEYKIIKETGFEAYFSLVYDLKQYARSRGIGMNVRGSAASSFVLYMLGLSIIDPLKYRLPFERFLNPQRREPPDIDVDVEFNQREGLIQEIFKQYTKEHVAHIAVINRFQHRARFRDTARAFGLTPKELKHITRHLGEKLVDDVLKLSRRIDDYPHYFSCHPSGIVITPLSLYSYVPLYPSPAGQITHFDKDGIGMVGLVKIDILGVRGFPALYLSRETVDFQDQRVYNHIGEGRTLGCFQIESPMVRLYLRRIRPRSLMDIANAIAIIRPGPAQGGMKERFSRRLKGEEKIEYPHPWLEDALRDTLGIPVYQEQILQIAQDFAHFSMSDGDMLRRAMTKDRDPQRMQELEELFYRNAGNLGHSARECDTVWQRIKAFSSFGFNKAHAVTYGTLAYLSAYQKFYQPHAFFCRVINNKGGYYPSYAYINEARRWGIQIRGPDINTSEARFRVLDSVLVTGLDEIKNLSIPTIKRILTLRPFHSAEQFFHTVRPSIDEGIALIKSGALDILGPSRPQLYFLLLLSRTQKYYTPQLTERIPRFSDFQEKNKHHDQLNTLTFIPEYHVLEVFYPLRKEKIDHLETKSRGTIIGTPVCRRVVLTKKRRLMSFVTLDDETSTCEVVLFPNHYKKSAIGPVMCISGKMQDDTLIADSCKALPLSPP